MKFSINFIFNTPGTTRTQGLIPTQPTMNSYQYYANPYCGNCQQPVYGYQPFTGPGQQQAPPVPAPSQPIPIPNPQNGMAWQQYHGTGPPVPSPANVGGYPNTVPGQGWNPWPQR
ncbi:hypothetical protein PMZ80_006528 [Knufia obscura]|uniref:Uncharacterized protein n=2 Tax=Knufia TaxID=430999 RepID=A0AAN8IK72_9EURO|nr:hypothetical protein PMZ80_006528 [Knufia obscura]KAK5950887.1 hypothetical protein OHC33_007958 [Knufia fluminis]